MTPGVRFRLVRAAIVVVWVVATFGSFAAAGISRPEIVEVLIWTSGEKQNVIRPALDQFNQKEVVVKEGSKSYVVHARSVTVNSGEMMTRLVRNVKEGIDFPPAVGGAPTIVSPSMSDWLAQVNLEVGRPVFDLDNAPSAARTPLVIITHREMADCLLQRKGSIGWLDIIGLAESPEGWGFCPSQRADWRSSKPLIGFTDPAVSSVARSTMQILTTIGLGKPAESVTPQDVADPRARALVQRFQASVSHYYPETLTLQTRLFSGPGFVHFMPAEEYNLTWLYRGWVNGESAPVAGVTYRPIIELGYEMVAIYPDEGTVWHDNPLAIPTASWVTPGQRAGAAAVIEFLRTDDVQRQFVQWGFRPGTDLAALPTFGINPTEPKKVLRRVPPEAARAIDVAWEDVKRPGVAALVVDASSGMSTPLLAQAQAGVIRFLDGVSPYTNVGLMTFGTGVDQRVPIGPLERNRLTVSEPVASLKPSGGYALYDAVKQAVAAVDAYDTFYDDGSIRAVVVVAGGGAPTGTTLSDLINVRDAQGTSVRAEDVTPADRRGLVGDSLAFHTEHPIHVFSIGVGPKVDWESLRLLAEATDGAVMQAAPDSEGIARLLEQFSKYF